MHHTCVIYNPSAGRGRAERWLAGLPQALRAQIELRPTERAGHAVELARTAVEEGFAKVVAAGGDGTVHEVANGVLRTDRPDVVFSVWPIGSANDFAYSLGMDTWWRMRHQNLATEVLPIDVGLATTAQRSVFFVCNLGVGFNGMINGEARKTRWLSGPPLYIWAFIKSMVKHFETPVLTIRFDDTEVTTPTLALSVLNAQREGNFPICPNADLTDGRFDYMHATRLTRWQLLRFLQAMIRGTLPTNHTLVRLGRVAQLAVRSAAPLCVHADGEFVCVPSDGVKELTVGMLPRRLLVEVYPPGMPAPRARPVGAGKK
jgi:diacylglycerol kinase family enzyme